MQGVDCESNGDDFVFSAALGLIHALVSSFNGNPRRFGGGHLGDPGRKSDEKLVVSSHKKKAAECKLKAGHSDDGAIQ